MMMVEVVGFGGLWWGEVFGGSGQGVINGRQKDDHQWAIFIVLGIFLVIKIIIYWLLLFPFYFYPLVCIRSISAWRSHTINQGSGKIATPSLGFYVTIIRRIWALPTCAPQRSTYWIIDIGPYNNPNIISGCQKRKILRTLGTFGRIRSLRGVSVPLKI